MPRETLDRKIDRLQQEVGLLESMVSSAILESVNALKTQNTKLAREVYNGDQIINAKRFQIENDCMTTIATQQPIMARDLRMLASILEVTGELERIGDYAKGIAKICLMSSKEPLVKPLIDIPKMAEITIDMLHRATQAFINHDAETVVHIPPEDDKVDELYKQVYRELVEIMIRQPDTIDRANYLMWAAHNLERMADRVTNICERTVYVVTGELKELEVVKNL